ncbi:N-acetylneuraminate synthase [Roseburia hominis]
MDRVLIIAEAGVNHNGSMELAKEMVRKAKDAGVDYIKFQTFIPKKLVSRYADKAEYQKETTGVDQSQLQMLEKLALTFADFRELKDYCESLEIGFISTPFDLDSIDFLETLDMDFWKVPSGEITNLPYLEKIGRTGRDIVMSTGMCEMQEIHDALRVLRESGAGKLTLLHCNTEYPTPFSDVNLKAMLHIERETQMPVGYSDHTVGIEIPVAAVALGATVIEKHFTLDKTMDGPDHRVSLEPEELKRMVFAIRHVEAGLGDGIKRRTVSEAKNISVARKSIVARVQISKGEEFSQENITVKRPGNGINPMRWYEVIGKIADKDYAEDEIINGEALK